MWNRVEFTNGGLCCVSMTVDSWVSVDNVGRSLFQIKE
jgi:hypothetical protein